ncbi:MAG: adenylate/guanylate cyclase domain-containing protein [Gammaproteobacteria bacterium]
MGEAGGVSPFVGIFYGVVGGMTLYNALIYAVVRDPSYREYVLALAALMVSATALDGTGVRYLWSAWPWLTVYVIALSLSVALVFTSRFLQLHLRMEPRTLPYRAMAVVKASGGLLAALTLLVPAERLFWVMLPFVALSNVVSPAAVGLLAWQGSRPARVLLVSLLPLALGVAIQSAATWGPLAVDALTGNAAFIGLAVAVVLQSLALADNLNTERRERARLSRLRRFFAPQVAQAILAEGAEAQLAPKRREVTVVFTDLRGFTTFAAATAPDEVMRVLREYHEVVGRLVTRHEGTLEHFAGDGVMIFFNAPLEVADPELRAVRMALDMRGEFERLRSTWAARGHELGVGIGIDCGPATVGRVGTDERWNYAAIGPVTNLAARLCGRAAHGEILVSAAVRAKVGEAVVARDLGEQEIKGLPGPVPVFSLGPQAA